MSSNHPLIPIIRDLQSALDWLNDDAYSMIPISNTHDLFKYVNQFNQISKKDHYTTHSSRYTSAQIDQAMQQALHALYSDSDTMNAEVIFETKVDEDYPPHQDQDQDLAQVITLVPVAHLPAVAHTRHQRASISFEVSPPNVKQSDVRIPAIHPIGMTAQRLQNSPLDTAEIIQNIDQETITLNENLNSPSNVEASVEPHVTSNIPTTSVLDSFDSGPTATGSQFWANNPQPQSVPVSFDETPQQEVQQTKSAFDLLLNSQKNTKSQSQDHQTTQLNHISRSNELPVLQDWTHLFKSVHDCHQCERRNRHMLAGEQQTQSIPCLGLGNQQADIVFVYEHLTKYECTTNIPLSDPTVAPLFTTILSAMKLSRSQVYITSLLKCSDDDPHISHWQSCQQYFHRELELIQPKVIISLGYMTAKILGHELSIGVIRKYRNIPFLATFDPYEVQRGGNETKKLHWKHLTRVMNYLKSESFRS